MKDILYFFQNDAADLKKLILKKRYYSYCRPRYQIIHLVLIPVVFPNKTVTVAVAVAVTVAIISTIQNRFFSSS